jgi:8-oxo-dGTP pyrophosphatase MutT (NUDIX family)
MNPYRQAVIIREKTAWGGRQLEVTWTGGGTPPPRELTQQASGLCFTEDGQIVLVAGEDGGWNLPGGKPEPGETVEQALTREVWEEACAVVQELAYLGAQEVRDPDHPSGPQVYYQTRFWARVDLEPFAPAFETRRRTLVAPEAFLETLSWGYSPIAKAILDAALFENDLR